MDAIGCKKKIAKLIIEKKADYILSLKGNQGNLHVDVRTYFESSISPETATATFNGGHGRIETRSARVTDKFTEETRYFTGSLSAANPKQLEHAKTTEHQLLLQSGIRAN